jgi:hypothetical protein
VLVILGAGASYDSIPEFRPDPNMMYTGSVAAYRPPLATELFANRQSFFDVITKFGPSRPLIYRLRRLADGASLEEELDRLQQRADGGEVRLSPQLAALRFYLREIIDLCTRNWSGLAAGVTNYVALVDRLEEWARARQMPNIFWVTFNYDLLLEQAVDDVARFQPRAVDDYITSANGHVLIKPHGSINWVRRTAQSDEWRDNSVPQALKMIVRARGLALSEGISIYPAGNYTDNVTGLFPALAIPVRSKQDFVCPQMHIRILRDNIPRIRRVLIIGWAANETNFLRLLHQGLVEDARILIVCGDAARAQATESQLTKAGIQTQPRRLSTGGFSDLFGSSGEDLAWLLRD